ncbi:MAG: hypothetical protein ACREQ5_15915, partial [Candidatus Dormibacteria bacterium]
MSDTAPWQDYQPTSSAPPAAAAATTAPASPNLTAPWLDYQNPTNTPAQPGYFENVANAETKAVNLATAPTSSIGQNIIGTGEAALKTILGMVAPVAAVAAQIPSGVGSTLGLTSAPTAADYSKTYRTFQNDINLIPQNDFANALTDTTGALFKPVSDVANYVARQFTNDPDKQEMLSNLLPYTLSFVGGVRLPVRDTTPLEVGPEPITNLGSTTARVNPNAPYTARGGVAVNNAKYLSDQLDIPLTNGQILAQGAKGINGDAATAAALNLPAQIERAVAADPKGVALNNFLQNQQGLLVTNYLDALNPLGDVQKTILKGNADVADWLKQANSLIDSTTPGLRTLDHSQIPSLLDSMPDDLWEANPDVAKDAVTHLKQINQMGDVLKEPSTTVPLTGQGSGPLSRFSEKSVPFASASLGGLAGFFGLSHGNLAGGIAEGLLGGYFGRELGNWIGGM